MWYAVNGLLITVIIALLCSLFSSIQNIFYFIIQIMLFLDNSKFDSNDPSLYISYRDAFCCCLVTEPVKNDPLEFVTRF
jgi:hypothetical protein